MQSTRHHAVFGVGDGETVMIGAGEEVRRGPAFVRQVDGAELTGLQKGWPSLQGPHNLQNAAVAVAIVEALGLNQAQWQRALPTFRGLPHRMERVAEAEGVLYINDSKATNPASAAPALAPPPNPKKRSAGSSAAIPRATISTNARPISAMSAAYTIGEAGDCSPAVGAAHAGKARECWTRRSARRSRSGPGDTSCSRRPAPASISSATSRRGATFRQSWRDDVGHPGQNTAKVALMATPNPNYGLPRHGRASAAAGEIDMVRPLLITVLMVIGPPRSPRPRRPRPALSGGTAASAIYFRPPLRWSDRSR